MDNGLKLILASTSPYRKSLLARLCLPFSVEAPDFDEAPPGSMSVETLIRHNTLGKAYSVAARHPDTYVIGADQLAVSEGEVLGKPGGPEAACAQLRQLSGRRVTFLTGVTLLDPKGGERYEVVPFHVHFRQLDDADIRTYVQMEEPWDCAGGFKSEGLGISLFRCTEGDDPTALVGLPLIRLSGWLRPLAHLRQPGLFNPCAPYKRGG